MNKFFQEKYIHELFDVTLILKAIHALVEIISGIFVFFVSQEFVSRVVIWMTKDEFLEDPRDLVSNLLVNFAHNFSVSSQDFVAFYLLAHGVIKIILITEMFRKRLWAYPESVAVFGLFIFYQIYRYTFTGSVWLIIFKILDIVVIALTIHEYRYMRNKKRGSSDN